MSDRNYEPASPMSTVIDMSMAAVALGAIALFSLPMISTTSGTARSAHIKWDTRNAEMENIIASMEEVSSVSGKADEDENAD